MNTLKAQAVSRTLGKEYKRSESRATRIRGWNHWSMGFTCEQTANGVIVDYRNASTSNQPFDNSVFMNLIRETLIEKGYQVFPLPYGKWFVTKKVGA